MARPGVMIYFDIRKSLEFLSDQQKGQLFQAILEYAELGIIPQFDGILAMAWTFVQPQIDRDSGRYEHKVEKAKYAVFVREEKKKGVEEPLSFDEWRCSGVSSDYREISDDIGRHPITNTIPTTNTIPVTDTTPTSNTYTTGAKSPVSNTAPATNLTADLSADFRKPAAGIFAPANKQQEEMDFNNLREQQLKRLRDYQV